MQREESIDIITLFHNFYRYKWSVLIILISILIGTLFYIKQITPIYSSDILVNIENNEVLSMKSLFPNGNVISVNIEGQLDYDITILKSRHIISKVLDKIDLSKRFFIETKWRDIELYREEIPFRVKFNNIKLEHSSFEFVLEELDKETFTFKLKKEKDSIKIRYRYGQTIKTDKYTLEIYKKNPKKTLVDKKYKIQIKNNKNILISDILNHLSIEKKVNRLLKISYEDSIPLRAKDIITQLLLNYETYSLNARQLKDVSNIAFLDKSILELEHTLKKIGKKLRAYKSKHNELLFLGSEDRIFSHIIEKNRKIANLSLKLDALKITKKRIEEGIYSSSLLENSNLQTEDISQLIAKLRQKKSINMLLVDDLNYQNILTQLRKSKMELQELSLEYTTEYPEVQKIQTNIDTLQWELEDYLNKHFNGYLEEVSKIKWEIDKTVEALISSTKKEHLAMKDALKKDKSVIHKLPKSTMKLRELKRAFELNENNYKILLQKRSEALISKESIVSNIQIIDNATEPTHPIRPKKAFLYISGLILGLFLSILYTSIRIYRDKNIYSKNDIILPNYSLLYDKERGTGDNLWTLIAHLEQSTISTKSKIILITANTYNENKISTTKELSLALEKISKKVLIIDFDVYYPKFTKSLNKKIPIGLSTLLTSKHPLRELNLSDYISYINSDYKNIDILSSGPTLPKGSALLFNSKIEPLLKSLSRRYDYILIDAPPIGDYPVTAILLKYINIFLIVAKIKKTDKIFFDKLNEIDRENIEKIIFLTD